ncbi:alpha/beta hydrolase [Bosea sp. 685]|uniref:alpha/beta fold hydrolase n=1 Tax=Bosea sp. 685 TaxID=3080057 RepID=UPI0028936002|nr:alpha/beta hydrolase [Bosea sp. 685]WNJ87935.1 alpha/beta hydrolase [Bosea sp. 685]
MKAPLLLISGMLCDETVWLPTAHALNDAADIQIINLGVTDSVEAMAEGVLARAPQRFALAGHSLGGRVVLEVARRAPERVALLGLFGTAYRGRAAGPAGQAETAAREAMLVKARAEGLRTFGEQWAARMLHSDRLADPRTVEPIVAMVEKQGLAALEAQVRMGLARPDAADLLPRIGCRTLILAARDDAAMPLGPHEEMANAIPDAELVVVERSGHLLTYERPDACANAIQRWLGAFSQT